MTQQPTPTTFVGKHVFTQSEKNQKTDQMLAAMRQKEEIEAEFKTTKSNYKSKIDAKDAEIKMTANLLNAGFEDKTFNVLLTKDFEAGKRFYHEIGTNVLVGEEPLTAADYQIQMNLEEKAIAENNKAADQLQAVIEAKLEDAGIEIVPEEIVEPLKIVKGGIEASEPEEVKEDEEFDFGDDDETDIEPF